jgi:hypothetical protein
MIPMTTSASKSLIGLVELYQGDQVNHDLVKRVELSRRQHKSSKHNPG